MISGVRKGTVGNVSEMNPSESECFLVGPGKLQNIAESGYLKRTLNPVGSNGVRDSGYHLRNVNARWHVAILEVPPHRNPHVAWLLVVAPPVRMRRRR